MNEMNNAATAIPVSDNGKANEVVDDGGEMAEAGGEAGTAARSGASYAMLMRA